MKNKQSKFRTWVSDLYYKNCDEREMLKEDKFKSAKEYFNEYKYWLKREFKHQKNKNSL